VGSMDPVVFVHLGAGFHSASRSEAYHSLCFRCCHEVCDELSSSGDLVGSLEKGMQILESSGLVNAGAGSNLNASGVIETDAGIMTSSPTVIGAVGAVRELLSPSAAAKAVWHAAASTQAKVK
jgi:taspase (threonine aspartase 1)